MVTSSRLLVSSLYGQADANEEPLDLDFPKPLGDPVSDGFYVIGVAICREGRQMLRRFYVPRVEGVSIFRSGDDHFSFR